MAKKPLAVFMGVTGNLSFAAGTLLLSLKRNNPELEADYLVYTDGSLPEADLRIMQGLGARIRPFAFDHVGVSQAFISTFTQMAFVRLEGLLLLLEYEKVLYLDVDVAVQSDISSVFAYGPLGVAFEDPNFGYLAGNEGGITGNQAGINVTGFVPGFDPQAPNINSGVVVFTEAIPDPEALYDTCSMWMRKYMRSFAFPDQAVINLLCQRNNELVRLMPNDVYNTHPRNPKAQSAILVHAYGGAKFWNDGLLRLFFPEWSRDYARWQHMGGSGWKGPLVNSQYLDMGPYGLVRKFVFTA